MSAPRLPRLAALLLLGAGLLVAARVALELCGGRAATAAFTGAEAGDPGQAALGAMYVAAHLASALLAPPLALAALVRVALERGVPGQERRAPAVPLPPAPAQG